MSINQSSENFIISKEFYYENYSAICKQFGNKQSTIVEIPIILPFHIPFEQGICNTLCNEKCDVFSFHFSDFSTKIEQTAGAVHSKPMEIPILKSRIEMIYIFSEPVKTPLENNFLSDLFDSLLSYFNLIILSYLVVKKDCDVHYISREMLEPVTLFRVVDISTWNIIQEGLFMLHMDVPYIKEKLSREETLTILNYQNVLLKEENPFILSEELMLNAKRYQGKGFYKESVFYAQTSVETFINTLYSLLLKSENISKSDIEKLIDETAFMSIIKKEMSKRIGGTWDVERVACPVGSWNEYTYKLRNKVIHAGYLPSIEESDKAIQCAIELREYILKLIFSKKQKFSDIARFFIKK